MPNPQYASLPPIYTFNSEGRLGKKWKKNILTVLLLFHIMAPIGCAEGQFSKESQRLCVLTQAAIC